MTTKTKEKNGKTSTPAKSEEKKNSSSAAAIAQPIANEAEKVLQEAAVIPLKSVEERFHRLEEFQALKVKHSKIKEKNQSLKVLKRSNDTLGAEISVSAGSEEITLNNAALVGEVLDLLSGKLEAISKETENEVLNFVI